MTPTEFMKKGNDGKPETASTLDQQPTARVACWVMWSKSVWQIL